MDIRIFANGATSQTTFIKFLDPITNEGATEVTAVNLDCYWYEPVAAVSAKVDCSALGALNSAYSSGGLWELSNTYAPGCHRFDIPDGALDAGTGKTVILVIYDAVSNDCLPYQMMILLSPTAANVTLANDAITAAKFDESTAFPVAAADTGATQIARVGADSDTLETLSDEIAAIPDAAAINAQVDVALNTAIPGSPTADSINERVAAIDDKLPSRDYLVGTDASTGAFATADKTGFSVTGYTAKTAAPDYTALGASRIDLSMPRSSTGNFSFTLQDENGTAIDVSGYIVGSGGSMTFEVHTSNTASTSWTDAAGIDMTDAATGVIVVNMATTTAGAPTALTLTTAGNFHYELWGNDATNDVLFARGTMSVLGTEGPP